MTMTADKLETAIERLRTVDAEAADVIENFVEAYAEFAVLKTELAVWQMAATKLAKMVRVYQTISPN